MGALAIPQIYSHIFPVGGRDVDAARFSGWISSLRRGQPHMFDDIFNLVEDVIIDGRSDLQLWWPAPMTHKASRLTFSNCPGLVLDMNVLGSSSPQTTVTAVSDLATHTITLADSSQTDIGDNVIVTGQYDDGLGAEYFVYRASVDGKVGDTIHVVDNFGIGGSFTDPGDVTKGVKVGMKVYTCISLNPLINGEVYLDSCYRPRIVGLAERNVTLHKCQHGVVDLQTRYGYYANDYSRNCTVSVRGEKSHFYGFGSFKCRNMTYPSIITDFSPFGGVVFKNQYDSQAGLVNVRQGLCYAVQVRDDTGTQPSTVDPNLQDTVGNIKRFSIASLEILESGRGLFIDNRTQGFHAGNVQIARGSGICASYYVSTGGDTRIDTPSVQISDHGQCLTAMGTSRTNCDVRIEEVDRLRARFDIEGSLHPLYVYNHNNTAGLIRDIEVEISVSSSIGVVDFSSAPDGVRAKVTVHNPAVAGGRAVQVLNACGAVQLDVLVKTPSNGNLYSNGLFIQALGASQPTSVKGKLICEPGTLTNTASSVDADLFIDATSGDFDFSGSELMSSARYGITVRNAGSAGVSNYRLRAENLIMSGTHGVGTSGAEMHKTTFTADDWRVNRKPVKFSTAFTPGGPFAAYAGLTPQNITVPQSVGATDKVEVFFTGSNRNGVIVDGYRTATNTITVNCFNATSGTPTIGAGVLNILTQAKLD